MSGAGGEDTRMVEDGPGCSPECSDDPRDRPAPVAIPHTDLSAGALRGVIDSFILREGTDYGDRDVAHEEKVAQVLLQLERAEARILFDPLDDSVTIVPVSAFRREARTTHR